MRSYTSCLHDDTFTIFLLHGVIPQQRHQIRNYTRKHLPLDDFVSFVRETQASGTAVSMDEIVEAYRSRTPLPRRAFAMTFDDGFENNVSVAAPVLDDLRIPTTFYVTTSFVGSNALSWTDYIESVLEQAATLRLSGVAESIDGTYATPQEKIALMERIRHYVKGNNSIDPYEFASKIEEQAGSLPGVFDRELDTKVTGAQLQALAAHPLFTVGGHGHTHRILSFLSDEDLEHEVTTSLRLLTQATDKMITHYSYPEGMAHCHSDKVIATLRGHGIACAPTAEDGCNVVGDSLFHLKRVFVV
jgi:peptidoglycan/xylan/chitin deacetylase (PgdA/CDA1 family)